MAYSIKKKKVDNENCLKRSGQRSMHVSSASEYIYRINVFFVFPAVLKDPDRNPYSILDTSESDQIADAEGSECEPSSRSRRSRRRRPESDDNTSLSENGLGKYTRSTRLLSFTHNLLLIVFFNTTAN